MIPFDRNTPVLLIVFNRPNTSEKVLDKIRQVKPKKLYVAADAPRCEADEKKCQLVRSLFDYHLEDCEVIKHYQTYNLGCDKHCYQAISWFFEQESEGIILEDDCVPSLSFFGFCSELLRKYREDQRIGHITGSNYQFGNKRGDGSYYFSNLTHVGGWAGWRRVWQSHIERLSDYNQFKDLGYLKNLPSHAPFQSHWNKFYEMAFEGNNDVCWDYNYAYSNLINNRLSIIPNQNMICNIGCYDQATHYIENYPFADLPLEEMGDEIIHPTFICPDVEADLFSQTKEYNVSYDDYFMDKTTPYLKSRLEAYSEGKKLLVPKVIHQIYEDLAGPPDFLGKISESWRALNPDWEYRFWDKNAINDFMNTYYPELVPAYETFPYNVQRWDVIRYLILYQFGGLYVDMDYECTESIEPLLCDIECAIGLEPKENAVRRRMPYIVGNAFMATVPKHPFFAEIIKTVFPDSGKAADSIFTGSVLDTTGPYMMTRVYRESTCQDRICLLPAELVAPLTREEVIDIVNDKWSKRIEDKIDKAYAIHYFVGSWYQQVIK